MFPKACSNQILLSAAVVVVLALLGSTAPASAQEQDAAAKKLRLESQDRARLSQLRVETRALNEEDRCAMFAEELCEMLSEQVSTCSKPEVLRGALAALESSKTRLYASKNPLAELLEACLARLQTETAGSAVQPVELDSKSAEEEERREVRLTPFDAPSVIADLDFGQLLDLEREHSKAEPETRCLALEAGLRGMLSPEKAQNLDRRSLFQGVRCSISSLVVNPQNLLVADYLTDCLADRKQFELREEDCWNIE